MFHKADWDQLHQHGIEKEWVETQLEIFRSGVHYIHLLRPCTLEDGIRTIQPEEEEALIHAYNDVADEGRLLKFVPASGAATRMFRDLIQLYAEGPDLMLSQLEDRARSHDNTAQYALRFFRSLPKFAFYPELRRTMAKADLDLADLLENGHVGIILEYILGDKGFGFAGLPKGLIPFHLVGNRAYTPFEEQLLEAIELVSDRDGVVRVHFTIHPDYRDRIEAHLQQFVDGLQEEDFDVKVDYSEQKPSTDTLAVTPDNEPFRQEDGTLLLRPGGHGALIENLNDLDADILLIKNIDNIVTHTQAQEEHHRKKLLVGLLARLQDKVFSYLRELDQGAVEADRVHEMRVFVEHDLNRSVPEAWDGWDIEERLTWLKDRLHRPLRVCGMVATSGEPGGGPFWVDDKEGESVQIVESSQINLEDDEQQTIFRRSNFFNPVDLVCGLKDHNGESFDLHRFVDSSTTFIAEKSHQGRPLKALELPGLWNGAMAGWNSVFVEMPSFTFNPVKTVIDLLRDEHRPQ